MQIKIAFWLPRTEGSVAVARQLFDRVFTIFGVTSDCRQEIALAVSEACSNAVRHAAGPDAFQIAAESEDSECVITVNDDGPGLSSTGPAEVMPAPEAFGGRGLALIRVTTDNVQLRRRRSGGLSVRMFKRLRWADGAAGALGP